MVLKTGTNHLSAICNNQYHIFDEDLEYLGSTLIDLLNIEYIQETTSPFLRIDTNYARLHLNILKKWDMTYSKQVNQPKIRSYLYFYNQTDALYISKGKEQYLLNYVTI